MEHMPEREVAWLLYGSKQEMPTVLKLDLKNKLLNHKVNDFMLLPNIYHFLFESIYSKDVIYFLIAIHFILV